MATFEIPVSALRPPGFLPTAAETNSSASSVTLWSSVRRGVQYLVRTTGWDGPGATVLSEMKLAAVKGPVTCGPGVKQLTTPFGPVERPVTVTLGQPRNVGEISA